MREEIEVVPAAPAGEGRVLSRDPENRESPPGAFARFLTPAEDRFVRNHYPVPLLGEDHAVHVGGAVVRRRLVTLPDLRALPSMSATVVTECAGNGRGLMEPEVPGERWLSGAVSNAQWTGAPLRSVIELSDTAVEVVFTGADGGYQRSLPREVAMDPATLLAFEMNGEPIPARFGGPVRLVVPGWYGMASVKWLARIEAVEEPFQGEFQAEKYVYASGAPVTRMRIKSVFAEIPRFIPCSVPLRIQGVAWGGEGLARVEVEIDGERHLARLLGPALPYSWRRFELDWTPLRPGRHVLACRATDTAGRQQPDEPERNDLGYGYNAAQRIAVNVI
ncbi:MAG TPA: molybdopterin-dependent oxidoreductase [Myxococcales bacterium]|nr:molybdopterin-dependent oxidoreductase [Myxococcales bacterium]